MARTKPLFVVLIALLLFSSSAWAGGMFLPFRGARATGRGGAFTAGVDDASALYYNPAGMSDIEDWSFLVDDQRGFTRFLNIVKARGPH